MSVTEQDVLRALSAIEDPDLHRDIVSLGFVQKPAIEDGRVSVRIVLTTPACPVRDKMEADARSALSWPCPGVREANVTMEANVAQHRAGGGTAGRRRAQHHRRRSPTRAASASPPSRPTSRSRWRGTAPRSASWTPTSRGRTSRP